MKSLMLTAAFAAMFFLVSCGDGKKEEKKPDSTEVKTEVVDTTVTEAQPTAEVKEATTDAKPEKEPETNTKAPVRGNK
ncbi:MAG TPA: hypothetical protein PLA88_04925 [Bacteroidales bacterium]|nr:hypothetical protein [Bacteroidales bacterium]